MLAKDLDPSAQQPIPLGLVRPTPITPLDPATLEEALTLLQQEQVRCNQLQTQLSLVQTQFQESQSLFQQLFNRSADANMLIGQAGFVACNQAAVEMLGCKSEAQFLALDLLEISPEYQPDNQRSSEKAAALLADAFEQGSQRFEWLHQRLTGEDLWVEVLLTRIEIAGQPMLHVTWRDVSDRKRAEAEIWQAKQQYQQVFETINDGLFITRLSDGAPVAVNPAACKMHGYTRTEFNQLSSADYIHPDSLPEFASFLDTVRAGQRFTCQAVDICKDGSLIDVEVTAVAFTYGDEPHALAVVRDITERKAAEAALKQNAQDLEAALRQLQRTQLQMVQSEKMSSLGQLVAGVAHEINNPVSFIYGNIKHLETYVQDVLNLLKLYQTHYPFPAAPVQAEIDLLELDFLKEDLPKTLASIKIGAERIREIVKSLRTFSRLDESACKAVDIHTGIDSSLVILEHRLKATAERSAIAVVKHYGDLPLIDCYAGQLNQVVMNILTNALDALEEQDRTRGQTDGRAASTITITTRTVDPDRVAIDITDNGPGIPPAIQNRIFDPFFTTKPVGKGTGMGMSISYQIVTEHHGGTLTCQSSPEGTTFTIEIPRGQEDPRGRADFSR